MLFLRTSQDYEATFQFHDLDCIVILQEKEFVIKQKDCIETFFQVHCLFKHEILKMRSWVEWNKTQLTREYTIRKQ